MTTPKLVSANRFNMSEWQMSRTMGKQKRNNGMAHEITWLEHAGVLFIKPPADYCVCYGGERCNGTLTKAQDGHELIRSTPKVKRVRQFLNETHSALCGSTEKHWAYFIRCQSSNLHYKYTDVEDIVHSCHEIAGVTTARKKNLSLPLCRPCDCVKG